MNSNSNLIIEISEQEFKNRSTIIEPNMSILFDQKAIFVKGRVFFALKDHAMKYCNNLVAKGLQTLIVENQFGFTIWIQKENSDASEQITQEHNSLNNSSDESTTLNADSQTKTSNKLPTKKVLRKYRGQTYEIEEIDYEALKQNQSENNSQSQKKYRGHSY